MVHPPAGAAEPNTLNGHVYTYVLLLEPVEFEWHEGKNERNIKKHGITFADAKDIWNGSPVEIARSTARGEERITVVGELRGHLIAVTYTERGERIRLISARPANRKERPHR